MIGPPPDLPGLAPGGRPSPRAWGKFKRHFWGRSLRYRQLIKSALEPVIRKTATDHPYDQRAALLGLKVVDPACGSGHFLLAAARRLAAEIARLEAAPDAPTEAQRQHALREVVQHSIYGVDKNPLAVELCKTALWIETVEPGKPLSFLDHRIRVGDSLIGVFDLTVLEDGIPDAAYTAKTGDDKAVARDLNKRNKEERQGQQALGLSPPQIQAVRTELAKAGHALEAQGEDDAGAVAHKAKLFERLHGSAGRRRLKDACDLWTAAFFARLEKPKPGSPERIPTTDAVREALAGQTPQALQMLLFELDDQHFFHWLLEFPEVFDPSRPAAERGFDVVLGNPPWERIKLQEQEFFAERHDGIAKAPNKAARDRLIRALLTSDHSADCQLHDEFQTAKHHADAASVFVRVSERFPLTAIGDVNTYALFAELFLRLISHRGRAGIVLPMGIVTDDSTRAFFEELVSELKLAVVHAFENEEFIFRGLHHSYRFCLLTVAGIRRKNPPDFVFFARRTDDLNDLRRHFALAPRDIALINPATRTCPTFRTGRDAELSKKIYDRVPVLIDKARQDAGDPWGVSFLRMFDMANDSGLFRTRAQLTEAEGHLEGNTWTMSDGTRFVPLYEAKMTHQYDHRYGSFGQREDERGFRVLPETSLADHQNPSYLVTPHYWVKETYVLDRIATRTSDKWFITWKDVTTSSSRRTVIFAALPFTAVGHSLSLIFCKQDANLTTCILANMNALVLDFIARTKISYLHLTFSTVAQLPIIAPHQYGSSDINFIAPRVIELTYTVWDMQPFAQDLGYDGEPYRWDPERRAQLRAELDAYYAWLYGLTRDELRYILDPKEVMGEDFPSETFRVLKEREIRECGEYRTRRLVLEAFDRFHEDGTFDPARVRDPRYFDAVTRQLATATTELQMTKTELEETKRTLAALLSKADRDDLPTLFVEGDDDARIVAAAWSVFFPAEAMPFKVVAANGTTQMRPLAVAGKALRPVIGDRLLLALADNDGEGRDLWREGKLHQGGKWMPQTNGVWWCLLLPSEEFRDVMTRFKIDFNYWPFTIENAFPAALRRQALSDGAYTLAKVPQSDLLKEQRISTRVLEALADMADDDPAVLYLRRPTPRGKGAFAAWITDPARLTAANYAAFEPIFTGLKLVIAQHQAEHAAADPPRQARLV